MNMGLDNEILRLARTYLGLNQKDFASSLGVSQALISKIEKGLTILTDEMTTNLKSILGETFFHQKMSNPDLKVHYRSSARIAKKYTDRFEARLQIISNNIERSLEYIDVPENKIPEYDLEDFQMDPKYLANEIRSFFGLGVKPIDDIVRLLENRGVIIHFYDYPFISAQNKNFDGVSFYVSGIPVILINDKIQNARKVFTIAHELAHLIMHHNSILRKDRDLEKEANQFASEFIAPDIALRGEFSYLTIEKLFYLKAYWKMSIGALLYKANKISLSVHQYRRWMTKIAPYRKHEPHDIDISKPVLLKKIFEVCQGIIGSENEFINDFGISKELLKENYSTIFSESRTKLKIAL